MSPILPQGCASTAERSGPTAPITARLIEERNGSCLVSIRSIRGVQGAGGCRVLDCPRPVIDVAKEIGFGVLAPAGGLGFGRVAFVVDGDPWVLPRPDGAYSCAATSGKTATTGSSVSSTRGACTSWAPGVRDRWLSVLPYAISGRSISRHRDTSSGRRLPKSPRLIAAGPLDRNQGATTHSWPARAVSSNGPDTPRRSGTEQRARRSPA